MKPSLLTYLPLISDSLSFAGETITTNKLQANKYNVSNMILHGQTKVMYAMLCIYPFLLDILLARCEKFKPLK